MCFRLLEILNSSFRYRKIISRWCFSLNEAPHGYNVNFFNKERFSLNEALCNVY